MKTEKYGFVRMFSKIPFLSRFSEIYDRISKRQRNRILMNDWKAMP